jgi:Ni,Fe-hydrogenase I large subunit
MGAFQDPTTSTGTSDMPLLIPRGVMLSPSTTPGQFDPSKITEDASFSWYDQPSPQAAVGEKTPVPDMSKQGAYTWAKSPSYNGNRCESGPLARELISGLYPKLGQFIHSIVPDVSGLPLNPKGSVFDRMAARTLELIALTGSDNTTPNLQVLGKPLNASLVDLLNALDLPTSGLMSSWLDEMDVGAPAYTPYTNPAEAEGTGLWEAPRGSLLHWIRIKGSAIDDYQVVAPSTWNVSPNGPVEEALVGTPVGQTGTVEDLRQAAFVVRSFDLCMACTVHAVDARGNERYSREV